VVIVLEDDEVAGERELRILVLELVVGDALLLALTLEVEHVDVELAQIRGRTAVAVARLRTEHELLAVGAEDAAQRIAQAIRHTELGAAVARGKVDDEHLTVAREVVGVAVVHELARGHGELPRVEWHTSVCNRLRAAIARTGFGNTGVHLLGGDLIVLGQTEQPAAATAQARPQTHECERAGGRGHRAAMMHRPPGVRQG
jgi:hypothetical protein